MKYGRVLIIEDEEHIVELLKFNLENNGYEVIVARDGEEGIEKGKKEMPDLILLDLMLPKIDGIEVCRKLKSYEPTEETPIIMLTAKGGETDKVLGLEIGADDYITKPFSIRELLARVKVVLRRVKRDVSSATTSKLEIDGLLIDIEKHEVYCSEKMVQLTFKEFELLRTLAENRGKVLSRNYLLDEIWGYDYYGETRTVDVHVRHLRKKIEEAGIKYIETVRGIGYKMK